MTDTPDGFHVEKWTAPNGAEVIAVIEDGKPLTPQQIAKLEQMAEEFAADIKVERRAHLTVVPDSDTPKTE